MNESRNKSKQCPVCYQQHQVIKAVCQNRHKLCEKCIFSLRKRQCPICKLNFTVNKLGNQDKYEIIFNKEDINYDQIAVREDILVEQQEIRRYLEQQGYLIEPNQVQNEIMVVYHPRVVQYSTLPYEEGRVHIEQNYLYESPPHMNQNYMRNQHIRQSNNEALRIQRRQRDREMYNRQVKENKFDQNAQLKQQEIKQQQGILSKIGAFFIDLGQKISGKDKQQDKKKTLSEQVAKIQHNTFSFLEPNNRSFEAGRDASWSNCISNNNYSRDNSVSYRHNDHCQCNRTHSYTQIHCHCSTSAMHPSHYHTHSCYYPHHSYHQINNHHCRSCSHNNTLSHNLYCNPHITHQNPNNCSSQGRNSAYNSYQSQNSRRYDTLYQAGTYVQTQNYPHISIPNHSSSSQQMHVLHSSSQY